MRHQLRAAFVRARELFRRRSRYAAEQSEEFSFHIEMETAENIRRGMTEEDARRAALLRFGGTRRFDEETTDARGVMALDNLVRDTHFALRRLHRARGFAGGVIATLGVGLGAAVGIGTIVYGVLLRDLPYENPHRLVHVGFIADGAATSGDLQSASVYFHFAKSARSFTELGAYALNDGFNITDGDSPERVTVALVTPNIFQLFRVRPILGSLFESGDTSWSNHRIPILISENLWRRRYGADPSIIGRQIDINRGERVVFGVLPRAFDFPTPSVDIYYPVAIPVRAPRITPGGLTVVGRLRDGVDPRAAEAELNALIPALSERFPAITPEILQRSRARVSVQSLKTATVASVRAQLVLLGILVAVVLLIATTNVANLFLLRAERSSQEIAIALSLGASRITLAQRFVIEGIVLGLASAVVALPAAALAASTKFGFTEREIPRLHEVAFTWETVAVVIGSAMLIGAGVGLIALTRTSFAGLFDRLRASRSTSSLAWRRTQNGLVAFQVAIALMLLIAAGLLGRSFWNLRSAKIGFEPTNAMSFEISLPWVGYTSYTEAAAFNAKIVDRLRALPGVSSVGLATRLPLASIGALFETRLQAGDDQSRPIVTGGGDLASADYFQTMGIPLRAGRSFRSGDLRGAPGVVVSERLARSLFGTSDVVGRTITMFEDLAQNKTYTVVGVAGDTHWARIEDGYAPMIYFPLQRDGDGLPPDLRVVPYRPMDVQYAIRGKNLPDAQTIQSIVNELDHRVPVTKVRALGALVDDATARVRLTLLLIVTAGIAALLLGVIGVYSVVSYAANGRIREFGIRLALGAAPTRLGGMVLGDGLRLVGAGVVAGLLAALGATRFLRALLYEVKPTSVEEFGIATLLLLVVTLVATLLPARRAARTHPALVLRGE